MSAKIVVVIGFLIAFAAGLTVGLETRQTSVASAPLPVDATTKPTTRQSRGPGWIESELKLRPDQKQKMDKIWSEMARGGRAENDKRRQQLREDRDAAIVALVGPENKAKYDAIQQNYRDQQQNLDKEMRARFENAVKQTEAILDPDQLTRYRDMLARHRPPDGRDGRGGPHGPGGPGGGPGPERNNFEPRRGDDASATSRPAPKQ
jgi:Spy/CpxP family protein refolding chaperone